ncbi:MAG: gamma-glutamylcyclotransferase family protein [Amphritea sp.]
MSILVFIYGTLKRGFANHKSHLDQAEYLGEYTTDEHYPLVVAGRWYSPCLMDRPGEGLPVTGELYQVTNQTLELLDHLERVDAPDGYRRKRIQIRPADRINFGAPVEVFMYAKPEGAVKPVHSSYLNNYQDRRYIPRDQRAL